jgi:hypothetical protein
MPQNGDAPKSPLSQFGSVVPIGRHDFNLEIDLGSYPGRRSAQNGSHHERMRHAYLEEVLARHDILFCGCQCLGRRRLTGRYRYRP